jgi:hypothetical protein
MTLTHRRCPYGNGKSIEAQRTDTMPCGAPRTLDPGFPGARSFADTPHPPMAHWQTPMALVVPVLSALTEGGGSNAATRLYGVSKNSLYRGQERLSG